MKIDTTNYDWYLASVNQIQQQNSQNNVARKAEERKDSYIHSISAQDMAVPSGTYDANGRMVGELPPVTSVNTDSDTNTDSSFLSQLSETFRANADSILSALDSLGLTLDDLSDKDNLMALANAMNEGAKNLGLPAVSDLEGAVNALYGAVSGAEDSQGGVTAGGAGGGSGSDEETTTTKIVTINGVTYLETTTTENGVSTTTRTKIGGTEEY